MARPPLTIADQGVFLGPDDADELIDLLLDAATVIGGLAGHPAAEAALAAGASGAAQDCAELTIDLRLAAARLDEDTTAHRINNHIAKHQQEYADTEQKRQRHAGKNQHSQPGF